MYRVGICDDDKILCSLLEEQIPTSFIFPQPG